jgi:hypothetical protein
MNSSAGCRISAAPPPSLFPIRFLGLWSAISDQKSSAGTISPAFTFHLYEASTHWHTPQRMSLCSNDIGTWRYTLHAFLNSTLNVTSGRRSGSCASQVAPRTGLGHRKQFPAAPKSPTTLPTHHHFTRRVMLFAVTCCWQETHCWHQNFSAPSWKPPQTVSCKDYSKRSANIHHKQYFYRVYSSVHSLGWCITAWNVCVYNPFTKGTYSNTLPYILKYNKTVSGFS